MALTPTPVCVQNPKNSNLVFNSGYVANTVTTLITAGPNGNKIVSITAVSNDTATHVGQIFNVSVTGTATLTSYAVLPSAGNDGSTANADMMFLWNGLPRDNDGQKYFFLEPNQTLGISSTSTLAVGKTLTFNAVHGQF